MSKRIRIDWSHPIKLLLSSWPDPLRVLGVQQVESGRAPNPPTLRPFFLSSVLGDRVAMACLCGGAAAWALPGIRCSLPLDLVSSPRAPKFPGRWNAVPLSSRFFSFSSYPVISSNASSALFCGGAQAAQAPPSAAPTIREICRGKVPEHILQR